MTFSIFDDGQDDCHCGGKCGPCAGQTDPAEWAPYPRLTALPGTLGDTLGSRIAPGSGGGQSDCLHGTGWFDPNGTWHCPSNVEPNCPAGQHVQGNYNGRLICAPDSCPAGQEMGWTQDGEYVICTNMANLGQTPCPTGYYRDPVTKACIRGSAPVVVVNPPPSPTPAGQPAGLFGLSPIMLLVIAGGGIFLLSSMSNTKGGK